MAQSSQPAQPVLGEAVLREPATKPTGRAVLHEPATKPTRRTAAAEQGLDPIEISRRYCRSPSNGVVVVDSPPWEGCASPSRWILFFHRRRQSLGYTRC